MDWSIRRYCADLDIILNCFSVNRSSEWGYFRRHRKERICSDIFLLSLETSDGLHDAASQKHSQTGSAPRSANAPFHLKSVLCTYRSFKGTRWFNRRPAVAYNAFFRLNFPQWMIRGSRANIGKCSICSAGLSFDFGLGNQIKKSQGRLICVLDQENFHSVSTYIRHVSNHKYQVEQPICLYRIRK